MVADAALELNLDEWQIQRAIARGILQAETVSAGEYRITDEAIQAAMLSGDLDGPPRYRDWLDDRAEAFHGSKFSSGVREILREKRPAAIPARDQPMPYTGAIRALGTKQPEPLLVAVEGNRELPYDSLAECYCVAQLRRNARWAIERLTPGKIDLKLRIRGPLSWLYRSRDDF